jgi:hypothetical protein
VEYWGEEYTNARNILRIRKILRALVEGIRLL